MNNETPTALPFVNPWKGYDEDQCSRLNSNVPTEIYNFIRFIRPDGGTMTTTINILFQKLVNELQQRNITANCDVAEFERFVAECVIIHPSDLVAGNERLGGPIAGSVRPANAPDDRGTAPSQGRRDKAAAKQSANLSQYGGAVDRAPQTAKQSTKRVK